MGTKGKEYRYTPFGEFTTRAGSLVGHAATFNEPYQVHDFREIVGPNAFDKSLKGDIRALWNHDPGRPLGRTTAGTLRVSRDRKGLLTEIDLPKSAEDVREAIERGDVTSMSFAFSVVRDSWERVGDQDVRTLEEVNLIEVSPCTFPANPSTDIAIRSRDAWRNGASPTPDWDDDDDLPELPSGGFKAKHAARRRKLELAQAENEPLLGLSTRDVHHDRQRPPLCTKPTRPTPEQVRGVVESHRPLCEKVAYHEAGHAVMALLEGRGIEELGLEFENQKPCSGFFVARRTGASPEQRMGGIAAELIRWPDGSLTLGEMSKGPWGRWDSSWEGDWQKVTDELSTAHSDARGKALDALWRAKGRLKENLSAVYALASRLLKVGFIPGEEAEKLAMAAMDGHTRNEVRSQQDRLAFEARQRRDVA